MVKAKDDEKSIKNILILTIKLLKGIKKNIIKKEIEDNNYKKINIMLKN